MEYLMKLNNFNKRLSIVRRWVTTTLLSLLAIALMWQGAFIPNHTAMAADFGNEVRGKASEDAGSTKDFIRDTAQEVKETARENAAKVDRATDENSFLENKAKRDAARIQEKANKDAARTQEAVDESKNFVESTVENIKDAFSN